MNRSRSVKLLTAVAASLAVVAIGLWGPIPGGHDAEANHTLTLGLDFDPSGTPANGVYNPASLPSFENCAEVLVGNQVSIDLFVLDVEKLVAFSSHIGYNGAKVKVVGSFTGTTPSNPNGTLFMSSQPLSNVQNVSQNSPAPLTGVLATPDTDGLYEASAADVGNVDGDTGYGVLARLTFEGVATGIASVSITYQDLNADTTPDTGALLRDSNAVRLNDGDGDGWYDGPFTNQFGTMAVGQDNDLDGFPDFTCGGSPPDNCPNDFNPSQSNVDGDSAGDACDGDIDGDGYWNDHEQSWGSDTSDATKTPDVCDGADNDLDGTTDEGFDFASPGGGPPNGVPDCNEAVDTDGDTIVNTADTDDDNDSTADTTEVYLRIDTLADCPATTGVTGHYAWMPDIDNNRIITIGDVLKFIPHFLTFDGDQQFNKRFDWSGNGVISIQDVLTVIPFFLQSCTP